jgi:hypothetical protein
MSNNPKAITKEFFAAYDAHDVERMLGLCADGAQGRYLPYGKNSVVPIRGGLEQIWRGFPQVVPDFGVEIAEMIPGEENTIVVQALLGGTMTRRIGDRFSTGSFATCLGAVSQVGTDRRDWTAPSPSSIPRLVAESGKSAASTACKPNVAACSRTAATGTDAPSTMLDA